MLYQFRDDQVIFLDDVDSIFGSMTHLGLLRSALWGSPRIVTYGSSQLPSDLPPRFEITSRFLFAANVIPKKNDAFKAVLSRCDIFELSATNEEVLELMRSIWPGLSGLTPEDCGMVIDFIGENFRGPRSLRPAPRAISAEIAVRPSRKDSDWLALVKSEFQTLGESSLRPSDWIPGSRTFGSCGRPSSSTQNPFKNSRFLVRENPQKSGVLLPYYEPVSG